MIKKYLYQSPNVDVVYLVARETILGGSTQDASGENINFQNEEDFDEFFKD